jgi:hypothetical protein
VLHANAADIYTVDVQSSQQLAQVQREVAFTHLAPRRDVIAQRPTDLEYGILYDLEHNDLRAANGHVIREASKRKQRSPNVPTLA